MQVLSNFHRVIGFYAPLNIKMWAFVSVTQFTVFRDKAFEEYLPGLIFVGNSLIFCSIPEESKKLHDLNRFIWLVWWSWSLKIHVFNLKHFTSQLSNMCKIKMPDVLFGHYELVFLLNIFFTWFGLKSLNLYDLTH